MTKVFAIVVTQTQNVQQRLVLKEKEKVRKAQY